MFLFFWACGGVGGVKQPIEFPHKKHIAQGLPCNTCHLRVEIDVVAVVIVFVYALGSRGG